MASIRKRGNGWEYRVSYKDALGNYKTKSKGGFRTKREAELEGQALEVEIARNTNFLTGEIPFVDYYRAYYENKKEKHIKASSKSIYEASYSFAKDYFKETPINQITNITYQACLDKLGETRVRETVRNYHTRYSACFKYAHATGVIRIDPSFDVAISGRTDNKNKNKFLSEHELELLSEELIKHDDKVSSRLLLLQIATGARAGELSALTYDDIDLKNKTVSITKTYNKDNNTSTTPKNKSSYRTITIDDSTVNWLREYLLWVKETSLKTRGNPNQFAFPLFSTGKPVYNNRLNSVLESCCEQVGIERVTSHALRHSHASLLLRHGLPVEYISERLGHSNSLVTREVYLHVIDELKSESDEQLNSIFSSFL